MSNYSDLLKHPKWQKKRLEIMSRDGFKCKVCLDEDSTLNVHHNHYQDGKKPWEYEDNTLSTLCEKCHKAIHKFEDDFISSGLFEWYEVEPFKQFGTIDFISVIGNVLYAISEGATKEYLLKRLFYSPTEIDEEKHYQDMIPYLDSSGEAESIECEIMRTRLKLLQLEKEEAK